MNRRQLLKGAALGGAVGLAAVGSQVIDLSGPDDTEDDDAVPTPPHEGPRPPDETPEPDRIRYADDYETVVDVVEAGADPEGTEPVEPILEEHADDDTLLSFRPGNYKLRPTSLTDHSRLGIAAAGDEPATFVAPSGECLGSEPYFNVARIDDFLLDGIHFDFENDDAGGVIYTVPEGDVTVRNVSAAGSCDEQVAMFRFDIRDSDSVGVVENLVARTPSVNRSLTGIYVGKEHAGELVFRNCTLSGFSDNGLYASAPGSTDGAGGIVHTKQGTFENNNISNVRLGSAGSTARNVNVVINSVPAVDAVNLRGIRLRWEQDQVVADCDIQIQEDIQHSFGGVVFHAKNRGALVKDTSIRVDSDGVPGVRTFPTEEAEATKPVFENVSITGEANRAFAAHIEGRDGAVFRNCRIEQTGSERGGLHLIDSADCRIVDSRIDVTGTSIRLRNASARVENTTLVTGDGDRQIDELDAENEDLA